MPNEKGTDSMTFTPVEVVDDMLDLLPTEIWSNPDIKFLDIFCKSGVFLERIYWRLEKGLREQIPNFMDRSDHILTKQLYGLVPTEELAIYYARPIVYGRYDVNHERAFTDKFNDKEGNIKVAVRTVDDYKYNITEVIQDKTGIMFRDMIKEAFGEMKFDVVVGNPPYNKGMDLDFVNRGFDLCDKYCVMITPAKWQTAADDQRLASKTINYKEFREKLVPHMSKVVYYPDCVDVFNVSQSDGITYYILDKNNKYKECIVVNKSTQQKLINTTVKRSINNRETLWNIGNDVVKRLGEYSSFKFKPMDNKLRYSVFTNTQLAKGGGARGGVGILNNEGNTQCVGISRIIDNNNPTEVPGASEITFSSNDIEECKSFVSWLNTKFTRFFVVINISKLGSILTDDYFRFVPAPPSGKFDHIYTDEELYKAFNLPQEYIDVIEAVIKERK